MGVNGNNLIYVDGIHSQSADQTLKGVVLFCLFNARSICNNPTVIQNLIADHGLLQKLGKQRGNLGNWNRNVEMRTVVMISNDFV